MYVIRRRRCKKTELTSELVRVVGQGRRTISGWAGSDRVGSDRVRSGRARRSTDHSSETIVMVVIHVMVM